MFFEKFLLFLSKIASHQPNDSSKLDLGLFDKSLSLGLLSIIFIIQYSKDSDRPWRYSGFDSRPPQKGEYCDKASHTNFLVSQWTQKLCLRYTVVD